jgi:hypothetical protein
VPHPLIDDLRQKRKEHTSAMLPFLYTAQRDRWHHFVAGDESWFFFNASPCWIWTLSGDNIATKSRLDIQSKTFWFVIMWSPSGFHVVDRLPNDTKMNTAYFLTNKHILLDQTIFSRGSAPHQKRLVLHLDHGAVHPSPASRDWLEEHDMYRMPQLPYSPALASSDFYLFPTVKEKLERTQVADEDESLESLHAILMRIDRDELNRAFQA